MHYVLKPWGSNMDCINNNKKQKQVQVKSTLLWKVEFRCKIEIIITLSLSLLKFIWRLFAWKHIFKTQNKIQPTGDSSASPSLCSPWHCLFLLLWGRDFCSDISQAAPDTESRARGWNTASYRHKLISGSQSDHPSDPGSPHWLSDPPPLP